MRFEFDKKNWPTIAEGEKDCYLLANGLGGYSSLSVIGSAARGDQALLMSAKRAPNVRMHLVTNLFEKLAVDGREHILTSQRMRSWPVLFVKFKSHCMPSCFSCFRFFSHPYITYLNIDNFSKQ